MLAFYKKLCRKKHCHRYNLTLPAITPLLNCLTRSGFSKIVLSFSFTLFLLSGCSSAPDADKANDDQPVASAPVAGTNANRAAVQPDSGSGTSAKPATPPTPPAAAPSVSSAGGPEGKDQHWIVCIDPGHPSEVGRGTSGGSISEITAAWLVALKVQSDLRSLGIRTVLTKNSAEEYVPNKKRAEIANGETAQGPRANLLVRLHCDALSGSGFAIYFPDRQGVSDGKRGPTQEVIEASHAAAGRFHHALSAALAGTLPDRGLHPDIETEVGRRQGALTGSIYSKVPVFLLEMCVLTNPNDEKFIASEAGQTKMANAITQGIKAAFQNP